MERDASNRHSGRRLLSKRNRQIPHIQQRCSIHASYTSRTGEYDLAPKVASNLVSRPMRALVLRIIFGTATLTAPGIFAHVTLGQMHKVTNPEREVRDIGGCGWT